LTMISKSIKLKRHMLFYYCEDFLKFIFFFLVRVNMEFLLSSTNNNSKVDVLYYGFHYAKN